MKSEDNKSYDYKQNSLYLNLILFRQKTLIETGFPDIGDE